MLTVYLDQAKWIDLSRASASSRHPNGASFKDVLLAVRRATIQGTAQFPLSAGHYIETWRQANDERRLRLAETMLEISRHVSMASPPVLCNSELDRFLKLRYGKPENPRQCPVFGRGLVHTSEYAPVDAPAIDSTVELLQLARRPEGFLAHGRGHQEFAQAYAETEAGVADVLRKYPDHGDIGLAMTAVAEIQENIMDALRRAGLSEDLFMEFLVEEPVEVIEALPTRSAALRLRGASHRNTQRQWTANDMNDVAYNACAVVHCDVIVTEKF